MLRVFSDVTVVEKEAGEFMTETEKKLKKLDITNNKGFGIYYDDPKKTTDEKCRSFVGGVIEIKDVNKITALKAKGFKIDSARTAPSVVAEFPIKSDLSYMIGPMKAYPAISKYMKEKGYEATLTLEIYDVPQKRILFISQHK